MADEGGKAVQKSVESMEQIRNSSQQISEIIPVISEIASQTNLLALDLKTSSGGKKLREGVPMRETDGKR